MPSAGRGETGKDGGGTAATCVADEEAVFSISIKRSKICRGCSIPLSEAGSNITGDIIARRFT